ncbi:MAG: porin family protein [Cytophagales bacterium]|nr:PorT family protein [Bernardetiaceae bacterium]MDW8205576.1 porin family protein [Cytophagales bacterium]
MIKQLFLSLCLVVGSAKTVQAQLGLLKRAPINLVADLGISGLRSAPQEMELIPMQSRSINIYYMKNVRISNRISFNVGVGAGMEKYGFANRVTLVESAGSAQLVDISQTSVRRSLLAVNYADLPAEFRFSSGSGRRAFRIAAGGKLGVRVSSHTKVIYQEGINKYKDDFQLNPLRYGIYGRVGYSSFSFFGYYGLSELFRAGKSPQRAAIVPFMLGISLSTF